MSALEIKQDPTTITETDFSNLLWDLATERDVTKRKKLVEEALEFYRGVQKYLEIPTINMFCACASCGHMGTDFKTVNYFEGDCDVECPKCGSMDTDEPQAVIRRLVQEREDHGVEWVSENLAPDEVFSEDQLKEWANKTAARSAEHVLDRSVLQDWAYEAGYHQADECNDKPDYE